MEEEGWYVSCRGGCGRSRHLLGLARVVRLGVGFGYEKIEIVLSEPLGETIGGGVDQAKEMKRMKHSRER